MTGHEKSMNYPAIYLIRVNKKTKQKLKKLGAKIIREILKDIH